MRQPQRRTAAAAAALLLLLLALLSAAAALVSAVDRAQFRRCEDTGFCRRLRSHALAAAFRVVPDSVRLEADRVVAALERRSAVDAAVPSAALELELFCLRDSSVRVRVRHRDALFPRYEVQDVLEPLTTARCTVSEQAPDRLTLVVGLNRVELQYEPLRVSVRNANDVEVAVLNADGKMEFEVHRAKPGEGSDGADAPACDGCWEETFKTHRDSKPRGPEAVGIDVTFGKAAAIYGIPEHSTRLALSNTVGAEPYRLYNLDVFEYEVNEVMALYGSAPFVMAHGFEQTVGMLFLSAAETFVDVDSHNAPSEVKAHWMSESGILDVFLFLGPRPGDVLRQYTAVTGRPQLPQLFATAYHQCRWNYRDEDDVMTVNEQFNEHDISYDVLWLDIEHTDNKKYFTWDRKFFPEPERLQRALAAHGRKTVTIIDPHIKRESGYFVHDEAIKHGLYMLRSDGSQQEYEGHCWPGASSWLDFFTPAVRNWWSEQFRYDNYAGSTPTLYTWNDMNEPSQFNGPEITVHKDARHQNGFEHRHVHNQYGYYQVMATFEGHVARNDDHNDRPFVLTRSFFAGSQRFGAIWTGDNTAKWEHLDIAQPMLLSFGVAGLPFIGSDVGGFFGNPEPELLVRWYQTAAFHPFFRGHSHIDTKRREPWVFGESTMSLIRAAIRRRYALLPYWYTLWKQAHDSGMPPMRPLFFEFPLESKTFSADRDFMVGPALLVHPVTSPDVDKVDMFLPGEAETRWYLYERLGQVVAGGAATVSAPLAHTPVFVRGGHVVPRRDRVRRSSAHMAGDPYTLVVALDRNLRASGELYVDDGRSFDYAVSQFLHREFVFEHSVLLCRAMPNGGLGSQFNLPIERIIIAGLDTVPRAARILSSSDDSVLGKLAVASEDGVVVLKLPGVRIGDDWQIELLLQDDE